VAVPPSISLTSAASSLLPEGHYDTRMRFGIFYEHQLPRPWEEGAEEKLLNDALEQIELADRIGIDHVWEVEHHFLEEYSHSSAPEVFLAAASQRTRRIRLGHGIVQLPPGFNHPARVAERIATLDLLSGGRVDFGTGESSSQMELGGFGVDRELKRAQWAEALDVVTRMLVEEPFAGHRGRFLSVPPRNVVPKPRQKPHPPLWVACSNIATIASAGQWGMGALGFQFVSPEAARAWVNRYYTSLTRDLQRLADYPVNANIAMVSAFMCAPTDEEAREKAAGWTFFVFCLSHYGRHGMAEPGRGDMWKLYQEWRHTPKAQETLKAGLIGSPETIRRRLAEFEATNVDQVILLNQTGRTSHQDICESLELFAQEVMPEFHAREPAHQRWKDDVLAGRIELEQLDTEGHKLYSHQNEDIVRLTPEELKRKMAAKEAARETGHRA
jgi:alkanesulfonate monooxygenase SsuD/methylene tetrahydromethanopterin reductase-like flavin-dependent oxidoreductase (luciferase family)